MPKASCSGNSDSPVHFAGTPEITNLLLAAKADPRQPNDLGDTPLHLAGEPEMARILLAAGTDPNAKNVVGETSLHYCIRTGAGHANAETIRILLEAGANVDATALDTGETPLHVAALRGDAEAVDALLEAGADPGLDDRWGRTPGAVAVQEGHDDVAELMSGPQFKPIEDGAGWRP